MNLISRSHLLVFPLRLSLFHVLILPPILPPLAFFRPGRPHHPHHSYTMFRRYGVHSSNYQPDILSDFIIIFLSHSTQMLVLYRKVAH